MNSIHDLLRTRLLERAGLATSTPKSHLRYQDLVKSEWSNTFEQLMRNRLIMGALRYGLMGAPGKPQYDRIGSIEKRLRSYRVSGNKEILVDVANLCLMEFVECAHPLAHFEGQDNSNHHVAIIK